MKLAALADARVQCEPKDLVDALTGSVSQVHSQLLQQHLDHCQLVDKQMEELTQMAARTMHPHTEERSTAWQRSRAFACCRPSRSSPKRV